MTDLYDDDGNYISRTSRKKDCDDTLELGEKILALTKDETAQFNIDE